MFSGVLGQDMHHIIKIVYYGGINCTTFVAFLNQENPLFVVLCTEPPAFSTCQFVSIHQCKINERNLST